MTTQNGLLVKRVFRKREQTERFRVRRELSAAAV
jgi:hypothetical protein